MNARQCYDRLRSPCLKAFYQLRSCRFQGDRLARQSLHPSRSKVDQSFCLAVGLLLHKSFPKAKQAALYQSLPSKDLAVGLLLHKYFPKAEHTALYQSLHSNAPQESRAHGSTTCRTYHRQRVRELFLQLRLFHRLRGGNHRQQFRQGFCQPLLAQQRSGQFLPALVSRSAHRLRQKLGCVLPHHQFTASRLARTRRRSQLHQEEQYRQSQCKRHQGWLQHSMGLHMVSVQEHCHRWGYHLHDR